ncbi:hypothetical protein CTEN210_07693 [Chaetoceros tenuissimus]|uniref:Amidase domain-containing protein n=1 Tax=Chaetoceros tenuissimus TaxID=426638 RepID=A0AAD3CSE4_9STRA|nr:hypothetical protein CTEN210_07693 [Chaetoceros tenuissimus]
MINKLLSINQRLTGRRFEVFVFLCRLPILGKLFLFLIKQRLGFSALTRFAEEIDEYPLYYPIPYPVDADEKLKSQKIIVKVPNSIAPLDNTYFSHWTISDYIEKYKSKTITPTIVAEKLRGLINELNKRNPILTSFNRDELMRQAMLSTERYRLDKNLEMDGVPLLIKDEIPSLGFPLTFGTSFIQKEVTPSDVPEIIQRLLNKGFLLIGKANQHELGIGTSGSNVSYGTCRNPYNEEHFTGGSSSGPAAAVSMGLVPVAIGSDGGGSIRIPASLCGCIGLKATYQRIPIDCNLAPSLVHVGPFANNVIDVAKVYSIMAGRGSNDFQRHSFGQPNPSLPIFDNAFKGLKIGVFWDHINESDLEIITAIKKALVFFESRGCSIVDIELPYLKEIHQAHTVTILTEMLLMLEPYMRKHMNKFQLESQVSLLIGKTFTAREFLAAQRVRSFAMKHIEKLFRDEVDIILSPATAITAPKIEKDSLAVGEYDPIQTSKLMKFIIHGNMTGIPAIIFPCDYDKKGLPISLQAQAGHWNEDLLLRFAHEGRRLLPRGMKKPVHYVDVLGNENVK